MRTKKILSILLAIAMLITMSPLSIGSFAESAIDIGSEALPINTAQSDVLIRPNATVTVTPVTRVCYSLTTPFKAPGASNSVVIAATPSGIAKNTAPRSDAAYAGETPTATTINFTPGSSTPIDESTLAISCDNSTVEFTPVTKTNGTYSWTVKDGAVAAVGSTLVFTVSYKYVYTDSVTGKTYNSNNTFSTTGYSYVEAILEPAGFYTYRGTSGSWGGTKNRAYLSSFVLGQGVYNESTLTGSANFDGVGSTTAYGRMQINLEDTYGNLTYINVGHDANGDRPAAHIYLDKGTANTLADQNVRLQTYIADIASEASEQVTVSASAIYEYLGNVKTYDSYKKEDRLISSSNSTELSLQKSSSSIKALGTFFTMPFAGNGPTSNSGTYTLTVDYQTAAGYSQVYLRHSYKILVTTVNKSTLRSEVQRVVNADPTSYLTPGATEGKGYNPQEWYYASGWGGYISAYNVAQSILNKPNATSTEIANAKSALTTAYSGLRLKDADYTEVNFYYNKATTLDRSKYTPASLATLDRAVNEYETGYNILYQPKLDQVSLDIKNALDALEFGDADYTAADAAVDEVNALMQDSLYEYGLTVQELYSNWNVVDTAVTSCGYTFDTTEEAYIRTTTLPADRQSTVDIYPTTINQAVLRLTLRAADYTFASSAISQYSTFKSTLAQYCTSESLQDIESAYSALGAYYSPTKTIDYQDEIDAAAQSLIDALGNYELRSADYSQANAAIARANALVRDNYADLTAVDNALAALQQTFGLDARDQATVDNATAALNRAIDALSENTADYSAVERAIADAEAENSRITALYADTYGFTAENFYTNWSNVTSAINAVQYGLPVSSQTTVNGFATAISNALANLTEAEADHSALRQAEEDAMVYLDRDDLYTQDSLDNLLNAVLAVTSHSHKISQQAVVDAYTSAIRNAIANLQVNLADYSAVRTAETLAAAEIQHSAAFAESHNGYPYYTAESIQALQSALDSVVDGLGVDQQARVTGFATAINTAKSRLVVAQADYTDVLAAAATVPSDLSIYTDTSVQALNRTLQYDTTLKANRQSTVDGFAQAIRTAVVGLTPKGADYTSVRAALANVPSNSNLYTAESWSVLQNAVNSVDYSLDINQQARVEEYAQAIIAAIAALQPAGADYSAVTVAIANGNAAINGEDAPYYTDASKQDVLNAIDAVEYGLSYLEQGRVNGFATAINAAVAALAYKPIDDSSFIEVKTAFDEMDKSIYTEESVAVVSNKIAEGDTFLAGNVNIKNQAQLDNIVADIDEAIRNLAMKGANYNAVTAALEGFEAIDSSLYSNYDAVQAELEALDIDWTLDITQQATVDAYVPVIEEIITHLTFKAINTDEYEAVKATIPVDLSSYTEASVAFVDAQIAAIDAFLAGDVNINDQAALDAMVDELEARIIALAKKPANYEALDALLTQFAGLNEADYTNYFDSFMVYSSISGWRKNNGSLDIDSQSVVDEKTALLQDAIDALIPVPTGYFRVREGSTAIISGKYITGLKTNLTAGNLRNTFLDYDGVTVTFEKANPGFRYYGTGSKVIVEYPDGTVEEYIIVIYGDVDGDSTISVDDAALVSSAAAGLTTLTAVQNKAGNVDGVRGVRSDDLAVISAAASLNTGINQVDPTLPA